MKVETAYYMRPPLKESRHLDFVKALRLGLKQTEKVCICEQSKIK